MDRQSENWLLALSALAFLAVVPSWAQLSLLNPSYWGAGGFLVLSLLFLTRPKGAWSPGSTNRRLVLAFLVLVPALYVAHWLRFGGSSLELWIQIGGLGAWLIMAFLGRRSDAVLWIGCVLHGLWDAVHFGRLSFVPEWYGAGCIAADVGFGAFVLIQLNRSNDATTG